jgi:hypothetical protein
MDEFGDPQNELYQVSFDQAKRVGVKGKAPAPRYHAAMAGTNMGLWVFGGTVNGKEGLRDFWRFDGESWAPMEEGPGPGFGLDLGWYPGATGKKGDLLLTGGIGGEFAFWKFSLDSGGWTQIQGDIKFPPYVGHKMFRMADNWGMIVGGHTTDGRFNNSIIWFSSFGKHSKIILCTGMAPSDRIWATYGRIRSFIFVVGGQTESQDFLIDVDSQQWYLPRNIGIKNSCPAFYGAACFCDDSDIWIHGGFSDIGDIVPVLYKVTLHAGQGVRASLPTMFSIQDCLKDDWVVNMITNPASVKDEPWMASQSGTKVR